MFEYAYLYMSLCAGAMWPFSLLLDALATYLDNLPISKNSNAICNLDWWPAMSDEEGRTILFVEEQCGDANEELCISLR